MTAVATRRLLHFFLARRRPLLATQALFFSSKRSYVLSTPQDVLLEHGVDDHASAEVRCRCPVLSIPTVVLMIAFYKERRYATPPSRVSSIPPKPAFHRRACTYILIHCLLFAICCFLLSQAGIRSGILRSLCCRRVTCFSSGLPWALLGGTGMRHAHTDGVMIAPQSVAGGRLQGCCF